MVATSRMDGAALVANSNRLIRMCEAIPQLGIAGRLPEPVFLRTMPTGTISSSNAFGLRQNVDLSHARSCVFRVTSAA